MPRNYLTVLRRKAFLLFVLLAPSSYAVQIQAWNFDWDDNIFIMPTSIILFHKTIEGKEEKISTQRFAKERKLIGISGDFADYKLDADRGSYREFRDAPDVNYFLRDIIRAMKLPEKEWQGPSLGAFQDALSTDQGAQWTTIITARGHSEETMLEGLKHLKSIKLIDRLPPKENLYGVAAAKYKASSADPSEAKLKIMKEILDRVSKNELDNDSVAVYDQQGTDRRPLHLWGFSDDDFGNFRTAEVGLAEAVKGGKWPNVKIVLFYTGTNHDTEKARIVVLRPDGTSRRLVPGEKREISRVLDNTRTKLELP